ncbi:MBL fold metallo-hydrolase [Rhizobium sp. LjRoot258]|uniref:MBL fold metallo-hydrolase n=1 Tax=Rhizobium sp. LjRoot258 TaxID=3342299 RepID=UPI003ED17055
MPDNKPISLSRRTLLIGACICFGCALPGSSFADAPMAGGDAPGFYPLKVGDFEVTVLSDGKAPLAAMKLLQGDKSQIAKTLKSNFLAEEVDTSHNCFLVNTGSKLVLIDAGAGSLLGPRFGRLAENIRAAGYRLEQIDEVLLTHMHTDHIGGLMSGNELAFPNANIRADKRDTDYWLSDESMRAAPADAKRFFEASVASLSPYQKGGRLKTFEGANEIVPGITSRPAYGHTPGHTMYEVESKGEKLLLWGDIVHVAAVQFADPTVTIGYDADKAEAEREHFRVMDDVSKNRHMIGGAHLPFPGLGHVRSDGKKTYSFVPLI